MEPTRPVAPTNWQLHVYGLWWRPALHVARPYLSTPWEQRRRQAIALSRSTLTASLIALPSHSRRSPTCAFVSSNRDLPPIFTSRRRHEIGNVHWSHASVCLSVPRRIPTLLHGPGCNLEEWQGVPSCAYWADLQSVHGFRCYGNIARTRNVSECLYSLHAYSKSCISDGRVTDCNIEICNFSNTHKHTNKNYIKLHQKQTDGRHNQLTWSLAIKTNKWKTETQTLKNYSNIRNFVSSVLYIFIHQTGSTK